MKNIVIALPIAFIFAAGANAQQNEKEALSILKKELGSWTGMMTVYLNGPDGNPTSFPIKETNTLFADRWVMTEFDAGVMQGRGQLGYDPKKKKLVGSWVDSVNPTFGIMEGEYDVEADRYEMHSTSIDPNSGKEVPMKSYSKTEGNDTKSMEAFEQRDGQWVKVFEIKYQRAK